MRWALLAVALLFPAAPALAQTSITLEANPVPIVDAQINGRPVRLEVDMRLPSMLALSASAAQRLHVTRVPLLAVGVGLEGSSGAIRGRVARPRVVFEGGDSRAFAGIFPVPVTSRADGVIGPGALPYDVVTIRLGAAQAGEREITFNLADANHWTPTTRIGDADMQVLFDVSQQPSVFNRAAARHYDANGSIVSIGDLVEAPVILGLRTQMQPVTTALTMEGVGFATTYARTNAPLLGADDPDSIVVQRESDDARAEITLGREALSRCSSISVDNHSKRMTLHCL